MTMAEKKQRRAGKPAAKISKTAPAKAARPKAAAAKKRAAPAKSASKPTATRTTKPKATRKAKPKQAPRRASRNSSSGFDIAKLLDHPLVADLLAVGAIAAVAAIADHSVKTRTGERESGSSKAVKAAGTAAAAAIGKRLMTEVDAIRDASKAQQAKRGSK
jgi:hypothetical protein